MTAAYFRILTCNFRELDRMHITCRATCKESNNLFSVPLTGQKFIEIVTRFFEKNQFKFLMNPLCWNHLHASMAIDPKILRKMARQQQQPCVCVYFSHYLINLSGPLCDWVKFLQWNIHTFQMFINVRYFQLLCILPVRHSSNESTECGGFSLAGICKID